MKRVLLAFLFCLIGFTITELILSFHHQQTQQYVKKQTAATGFSIERAPSDSLKGAIASMSGDVQWQSRIATQPAQLKQPRVLQQGEELWTGKDGKVSLTFGSGLSLNLLPNTHVNFIQTLPTSIVIKQDQGTSTYTGTKNNLSVTSLSLLTTLKQGVMTVTVMPDQNTVSENVLSGQATAAYDDDTNTTTIVSVPSGQTFLFDGTALEGSLQ